MTLKDLLKEREEEIIKRDDSEHLRLEYIDTINKSDYPRKYKKYATIDKISTDLRCDIRFIDNAKKFDSALKFVNNNQSLLKKLVKYDAWTKSLIDE